MVRHWKTVIQTLLVIIAVLVSGAYFEGREASEVKASPRAEPEWQRSLPPDQPGFPVALSGAALI